MKKNTIKKALISLSFAFAVSAAFGVNALVAKADDTIHSAFSTFALREGASVRLVEHAEEAEDQYGYSYVMEMSTDQYEAVMSQDSDFTNVRFGVLIGPEAYFDAHPFNTQANIDEYYSLNVEAEGKAFLYDIPSTGFVGDEEKVYYRASITEIKDFIRDMRGVAYVSYTYEGNPYKFFFTEESNMRCAVEVADLTIDTLDKEEDAELIETLQTSYINKVDWSVEKENAASGTWYTGWGTYAMGAVSAAPNANPSWVSRYKNNRYVNSKYSTNYQFVKEGEEPVAHGESMNNCEGTWTLKGVTTCEFLNDTVESYSRDISFQHLHSMPANVNGASITGTKSGVGADSSWANSLTADSARYNEATDTYSVSDPVNWGWIVGWGQKAMADFIFDFTLNTTSSVDFRIYTATDKWIGIRTNIVQNGFFTRVTAWASEATITGTAAQYTLKDGLNLRIAMFNKTLYFFTNTYTNESNEVVYRDNWMLVATMNTSGLVANNGMVYTNKAQSGTASNYKAVMDAATNNEFAFALVGVSGGDTATTFKGELIDDDKAVYDFVKANSTASERGMAMINGSMIASSHGNYWKKDANDVWSQSTADGNAYAFVAEATGDFMATMKINSTSSQANMRFWYGDGTFVEVMSPSNNELFFTANGKWASESEIGADTSVFHNEDIGSVGDGWLDVMIVKYNGTFSIYICEYLDGEGNAATYANWTLMYNLTSAGVETYGTGFSRSWSNGWGNVQNGIKGLLSANEVAVALHCRSGLGQYKLNIVDDNAAVAAFVASDKAVATYAKA